MISTVIKYAGLVDTDVIHFFVTCTDTHPVVSIVSAFFH